MTIYFTSDLHFGHANCIRLANRPFADVDEMNRVLIANINSVVRPRGDILYILGDFSFKIQREEAAKIRHQINCRAVHLIKGNHDKNWTGDLQPFSTVQDYLETKLGEQKIKTVLFHYPLLSWNMSHHGSIHLHGHIHADVSYNDRARLEGRRRFDVGVDANNYMPVSEYQILEWCGLT